MNNSNLPNQQDLLKNKYISLITYKKDKIPVITPVWFVFNSLVSDDNRLYLTTSKKAGKLKRLRNITEVSFAFCSATGKVHSEYFKGTGRILPVEEYDKAHNLLKKKYGLIFKLWATFYLRKNSRVYFEIIY